MKRSVITLMFLSSLTVTEAHAAKWVCMPDPVACPSGDHIRCIGHGWCGPSCDYCHAGADQPAHFSEPNPSQPFTVEASERYSPWGDQDECSAARGAVERKASTLCHGQSAHRVSEFTQEYGVGGPLMCKASALFKCEGQ